MGALGRFLAIISTISKVSYRRHRKSMVQLSHQQNVGEPLERHFPNSQFKIIWEITRGMSWTHGQVDTFVVDTITNLIWPLLLRP